MSDLIQIGRSGVLAYRGALAAVGENVTNADTEGYSRRTVVMREQIAPAGPYALNRTSNAFGGVRPSAVERVWDQYRATNAWSANSDANRSSVKSQFAAAIETALGDDSTGVGTRLTAIFTSASRLAADPTNANLRQTMLGAIGDAATALRQTASDLAQVAGGVRTQAETLVTQTNDKLAALGQINLALHATPPGTAARAQMEDKRDQLLSDLSANVAVDVTFDAAGAVTLKLSDSSGPTLLAANDISPGYLNLQVASDGRLATTVTRAGVTSSANPTGGALAGLVDQSNGVAGRRQQLDGIANQLIGGLNAWQADGRDANGAVGAALLTGTSAATIAIATTDPAAIAAATTAGGANANLLVLTALRGAGGVEANWRTMITDQALQVSSAKTEAAATATRKDGMDGLLDETTGVDLDVEAAELLRFQQAYSASAKIIQTARQTFQDVLALF